jgi:iron complex outermembrane receptor protein
MIYMTARFVFTLGLALLATIPLAAQTGQIRGEVTAGGAHEEDGEKTRPDRAGEQEAAPVVGATVRLDDLRRGAVTRSDGSFTITDVSAGVHRLLISSVGYRTVDTTVDLAAGGVLDLHIVMEPKEEEGEEVVVTATRTQRSIDDVPVRIEVVPQEEVEEKLMMSPSNVAMLLNESTGMRVQTTSPTTGTANLRIQGLPGRYTQILVDGVPNVGGLAAGFGLTELPPLNLRQVEIIKGAASALYGASARSMAPTRFRGSSTSSPRIPVPSRS